MGLFDYRKRSEESGIVYGAFPFQRGEMLTESAFGETPLLKLTEAQPILITHDMIKRKLENIGYIDMQHSGPFGIKAAGSGTNAVDGWEQIGGFFTAQKYGMHIPQSIFDGLITGMIASFAFGFLFLFMRSDLAIILTSISWMVTLICFLAYSFNDSKRKQSMISAKLMYQGYRKLPEKPQLGEELLDSMLVSVSEYKLGPLSEFLQTVGEFNIAYSNELKLIACYSLDARSNNALATMNSDIMYLNRMIPDSLGDSSTNFTAMARVPTHLQSEIQVHKKKSLLNFAQRFPVNEHRVTTQIIGTTPTFQPVSSSPDATATTIPPPPPPPVSMLDQGNNSMRQ